MATSLIWVVVKTSIDLLILTSHGTQAAREVMMAQVQQQGFVDNNH
jgi:hypothetical protein